MLLVLEPHVVEAVHLVIGASQADVVELLAPGLPGQTELSFRAPVTEEPPSEARQVPSAAARLPLGAADQDVHGAGAPRREVEVELQSANQPKVWLQPDRAPAAPLRDRARVRTVVAAAGEVFTA